jgi:hypothetical protein
MAVDQVVGRKPHGQMGNCQETFERHAIVMLSTGCDMIYGDTGDTGDTGAKVDTRRGMLLDRT